MIRISGRLERASERGCGYDLFARQGEVVLAGQWKAVPTGVELGEMPPGLMGHVCGTRAMMAGGVLCSPVVLEGGAQGEIVLLLFNAGQSVFRIAAGERVGQLFFSLALHPKLATSGG